MDNGYSNNISIFNKSTSINSTKKLQYIRYIKRESKLLVFNFAIGMIAFVIILCSLWLNVEGLIGDDKFNTAFAFSYGLLLMVAANIILRITR